MIIFIIRLLIFVIIFLAIIASLAYGFDAIRKILHTSRVGKREDDDYYSSLVGNIDNRSNLDKTFDSQESNTRVNKKTSSLKI